MSQILTSFPEAMGILTNFFNLGVASELSISEKQRIRVLNKMAALVLLVTAIMTNIDLIVGLYVHAYINAVSFFILFGVHYYLQSQRKYQSARIFFISYTGLFLAIVSALTISQGRPTDVENILFIFSAAVVFLFSGGRRAFFYFFLATIYFLLKTYKFYTLQIAFDSNYMLMMINAVIAFAGIYFFSNLFGVEFTRGLDRSEKLNEQIVKQREEHLKTKLMLSTMINNLPLILSMVDKDGYYIMVNDRYCSALNIKRTGIIGKHYTEVLPANIYASHGRMIHDSLTYAKEIDFQEETLLPSGQVMQTFGTYFPIINDDGVVEGMTSYVTDVTELKKNERRLEQLIMTKNKLFSVLAHELKSPIILLQQSLKMWNQEQISSAEWNEIMPGIERKLMALTFTMENVMTWAKSQFEGFRSARKMIQLNRVIMDLIENMAPAHEEKEINVIANFQEKYEVYADESHVTLLIRNIFSNAIKFTPPRGKISFSISKDDEYLFLEITDSGMGIDPSMLEQINFGKNTSSIPGTENEQGNGIGLIICQELVQYNQGTMQFESEQGRGTKVKIKLKRNP